MSIYLKRNVDIVSAVNKTFQRYIDDYRHFSNIFGGPKNSPAMLSRQALHAESITLDHPTTGERVTFSSPLPSDIQGVLDGLRKYASVS